MIHASFSEFRKRMAHYMDRVHDDADYVLVTRQGREPSVILPLSMYERMTETAYLLSDPANAAHLREGIGQAERGELIEVEWDEAAQAYKRR